MTFIMIFAVSDPSQLTQWIKCFRATFFYASLCDKKSIRNMLTAANITVITRTTDAIIIAIVTATIFYNKKLSCQRKKGHVCLHFNSNAYYCIFVVHLVPRNVQLLLSNN